MYLKLVKMKPSALLILLMSAGLVSCGPSKYIIDLEMRKPCKSGIELVGKNISVVYLENEKKDNSTFNRGMAEGFAESLEKEYSLDPGEVGLYSVSASAGSDYSSRDSLFNILMDTGSDVVFLLDTVKLGNAEIGPYAKVSVPASPDSSYLSSCKIPFTMKLFCYDGMNKEDFVKSFSGTSVANPVIYSDGTCTKEELKARLSSELLKEGIQAGKIITSSFTSQWKVEQFSILYFDSSKWYQALQRAENFDWKGAMDIWMLLLESNDLLKSSCAAYNLALACHILGNDTLAREWLDQSDATNPLPMSEMLRKRLL